MTMTRADFGRALREELNKGYDVVRIARWAYELHLNATDFEVGLEPEILRVVAMEEGNEFELSEEELGRLADALSANRPFMPH
jgi:hypothetical protein